MASRRGGSFNSARGRRKSPPASLSSEQQKARANNLRATKYTVRSLPELTFLELVRPTAPGCLCLWETLFCMRRRPPSRSFFAISSVRSSRPRPSRTPTALLFSPTTTKPVLGEKAGLYMTDVRPGQWERATCLKVYPHILSVCYYYVASFHVEELKPLLFFPKSFQFCKLI